MKAYFTLDVELILRAASYKLQKFSINSIRTFDYFASLCISDSPHHSFQVCVINNPKNYAADFSISKVFFSSSCCYWMLHYNIIATKVRFSVSGTVNKIVHEKSNNENFFPFSFSFVCTNFQWLGLNWLSMVAILVIDVMKQLLLLIFRHWIWTTLTSETTKEKKRKLKWVLFLNGKMFHLLDWVTGNW